MPIIKVPLHSTAELAGSDVIGRLHITDDIAEQIVAASPLPGKFAAHEANTLQRLASIEQHVNTLVLSADADTAWKNNAETKMRNSAGLVESTAALLLRVKAMEGSQDDATALRSKLDSIQSALGVPTQHVGDERVDEVYAIEQIRAKLAQLEKDKADDAGETQDAIKRECAEHNATKGALEEMKERAEKAELMRECLRQIIERTMSVMDSYADKNVKEASDYLREEVKAYARGVCIFSANDTQIALQSARAEADALRTQWSGSMVAAKKDAEALRAELHATKLSVSEWHADSERLSLEVAALKARKVKLPSADASASGREGDDYHAYADGLRSMLVSCEDAIRAAGVEVES